MIMIQGVVGAELQPRFGNEVVVLDHGSQRVDLTDPKVSYLRVASSVSIKTLGSASKQYFWLLWRREFVSWRSCEC